ncbi:MAG: 16S rRNA processing protein RimM [Sandaracinaceae bacterium]|nr:16S rRNA processing protein RimM [Sandaracinaceae bacterium]
MAERPRSESLVALAGVGRPHGVRGEVRVHPFNPESTLLLGLDRAWLKHAAGAREVEIEEVRAQGDFLVVQLAGVTDREAAEALRGAELCLRREELPEPEPGEIYHVDVIGLVAKTGGGEDVGVVSSVVRYPASDVLVVEGEAHVYEIPWLEPYVVELDPAAGRLIVAGLEDLEPLPKRR